MEEPIKNPPQPPPSVHDVSNNTRKRPLENDAVLPNSKHLKLRHIIKDLRPHFLEVLRTPDFRNCKAANEIQEQTKLLIELYKQAVSETASNAKKAATESQTLPVENKVSQTLQEKVQTVTTAEQLQNSGAPAKPSNSKVQSSTASEKPSDEAPPDPKGSYVVGGSAFGWNFITFTGKDPVYYGVTKETFRATYVAPS